MISIITRNEVTWFDWNDGANNTEVSLWDQMCGAYGITHICHVPQHCDTMEMAMANASGTRVFVEMAKRVSDLPNYFPLKDFVHPADAVYIFGNTAFHNADLKQEGDYAVSIITPQDVDLFGVSACAMILYDRWLKENGS